MQRHLLVLWMPLVLPQSSVAALPEVISELGIYLSLDTQILHPAFNKYTVNAPLWSDGLDKSRYFQFPSGLPAIYSEPNGIELPAGTLTVKEFRKNDSTHELIETRVMRLGPQGWEGAAYLWQRQGNGNEAIRVDQPTTVQWIENQQYRKWTVPDTQQCMLCHQPQVSASISFSKEQIFGPALQTNPVMHWIQQGWLSGVQDPNLIPGVYPSPGDITVSIAERARAYVAVNCSGCHSPTGTAPGGMDLRASIPEDAMGLFFVPPSFGELGLNKPFRILPGSKEKSVFWERMRRVDQNRMPPIGSHLPDLDAIHLIGDWIDQH